MSLIMISFSIREGMFLLAKNTSESHRVFFFPSVRGIYIYNNVKLFKAHLVILSVQHVLGCLRGLFEKGSLKCKVWVISSTVFLFCLLIQFTSWLSGLVLEVFMRTSWLKHSWVRLKWCWCSIWGTDAGDKAKLMFSDSGSAFSCYSHVHKSGILSPHWCGLKEIFCHLCITGYLWLHCWCVDLIHMTYFATPRVHSKVNLNSESTVEWYEFMFCHKFALKLS